MLGGKSRALFVPETSSAGGFGDTLPVSKSIQQVLQFHPSPQSSVSCPFIECHHARTQDRMTGNS
jgi:hypothetical protein